MRFKLRIKFLITLWMFIAAPFLFSEKQPWVKVENPDKLPFGNNLSSQNRKEIIIALDESLTYLRRPGSKHHFPKHGITHARTLKSIEHFKKLLESAMTPEEIDRQIKKDFEIYKSVGDSSKKGVLFTGYYEPIYEGSVKPTARFHYPLYGKPGDLVLNKQHKVVGRRLKDGSVVSKYWTRQDIDDRKVLKGQNLELVYLDNPYDVYMAQFQGSVAIKTPEGELKRYGYSTRNCSTVKFSLPAELLQEGVMTQKELLPARIANYFYQHPDKLPHFLKKNPSYVFFKERKNGPWGALSVFLQGSRAISTDHRLFPKAALAFVDLKLYKDKKNHAFQQFVLNQDTGGAVMGPGRCEIFFGTGEEAEQKARDMFSVGQLYFLFLKEKN